MRWLWEPDGDSQSSARATNKGANVKTIRVTLAALAVLVVTVTVQPGGAGKLGVGLMGGEPSGLSVKAWLSGNAGVTRVRPVRDGSVSDRGRAHGLPVAQLRVVHVPCGDLPLYHGIGGRIKLAVTTPTWKRGLVCGCRSGFPTCSRSIRLTLFWMSRRSLTWFRASAST